jgi:hypothetical protein
VQDFWGRLGVVGDLPVYFEQIPLVDDVWWDRLVAGLRELLAGGPPIEESRLRLPQRLVGWLVVQDRRADAERVVTWMQEHPGPMRLQVVGDRVVAPDLPFSTDPGYDLPDALRCLGPHELVFDSRLVAARWDESVLVVTGWALVRGAPTTGVDTSVRIALTPAEEPGVGEAIVTRFPTPEATQWIDRGDQVYDDSGFVARIDLADWLRHPVEDRRELVVSVEVDVAEVHGAGALRSRVDALDPGRLPARPGAALAWRPGTGLVVVPR